MKLQSVVSPNPAEHGSAPPVAVVVATYNRAPELASLLDSLATALEAASHASVWLVDNGSSDATPDLLQRWCSSRPYAHWLRVSERGKSRALNAALEQIESELVLFTDDDVVVDPHWVRATQKFFAAYPEAAATAGRILPLWEGSAGPDNSDLPRGLWSLVLPVYDLGPDPCEVSDFYGANVAVRLQALLAVGTFDVRLGPGAMGLCEDLELARRLRHRGYGIWYNPAAVVYHRMPKNRLERAYLLRRASILGRSLQVAGMGRSFARDCAALAEASLKWLAGIFSRNAVQQARAEYRIARHWGSLQARFAERKNSTIRPGHG